MHVNSAEKSIVCKLTYVGPPGVGKGEMLLHLYQHFAAVQGEHTTFEERSFASREDLSEMSDEEFQQFSSNAETALSASYDDLVRAGELVWFRTRLAEATASDQFSVHVDAFTVSGPTEHDVFAELAMKGADCVVFVADPEDEDATLDSWDDLRSDWDGPVVLVVNGAEFTEEVEEWLGFDGEAFAEPGGFDHSKIAFETAAKIALRHARSSN